MLQYDSVIETHNKGGHTARFAGWTRYTAFRSPVPPALGGHLNPKYTAIFLLLVATVAFGISYWSGLHFWIAFATVAFAFLLNGFFATVEDDLPGGFNNPDGTDTPAYIGVVTWVSRGILVVSLGFTAFILWLWRFG